MFKNERIRCRNVLGTSNTATYNNGAYSESDKVTDNNGAYYESDKVTYNNGAYDESNKVTYNNGAYYESNKVTYNNGAYYESNKVTYHNGAYYESNKVTYNNGAYYESNKVTYHNGAYYESNKVTYNNGAYYESNKVTYNNGAYYESNKVTYHNGAYYESNKVTYNNGAYYESNKVTYHNGAYSKSDKVTYNNGAYYESNKVSYKKPNIYLETNTEPDQVTYKEPNIHVGAYNEPYKKSNKHVAAYTEPDEVTYKKPHIYNFSYPISDVSRSSLALHSIDEYVCIYRRPELGPKCDLRVDPPARFNFSTSTLVYNNLGGFGPNTAVKFGRRISSRLPLLWYRRLFVKGNEVIDLVLRDVLGTYRPSNTARNAKDGVSNNGRFNEKRGELGQINLKCGTWALIEFMFINASCAQDNGPHFDPSNDTSCDMTNSLQDFLFKVFDLDYHTPKRQNVEQVTVCKAFNFITESLNGTIHQSLPMCDGRDAVTLVATTDGITEDNPDIYDVVLNVQATKVAEVLMDVADNVRFKVNFTVGEPDIKNYRPRCGRRIIFSGEQCLTKDEQIPK